MSEMTAKELIRHIRAKDSIDWCFDDDATKYARIIGIFSAILEKEQTPEKTKTPQARKTLQRLIRQQVITAAPDEVGNISDLRCRELLIWTSGGIRVG